MAYTPPWIARVTELQSNAAINVDAERKVVKLHEEMRDLVREMRTKVRSSRPLLRARSLTCLRVTGPIISRERRQDRADGEADGVGQEAGGRDYGTRG